MNYAKKQFCGCVDKLLEHWDFWCCFRQSDPYMRVMCLLLSGWTLELGEDIIINDLIMTVDSCLVVFLIGSLSIRRGKNLFRCGVSTSLVFPVCLELCFR